MANDVGAKIILCMDTNLSYVMDVFPEAPIRKVDRHEYGGPPALVEKSDRQGLWQSPLWQNSNWKRIYFLSRIIRKRAIPPALPPFRGRAGCRRDALHRWHDRFSKGCASLSRSLSLPD